MEKCERCVLLEERIKDIQECKLSHSRAAGRLAKRNRDLREEIAYLHKRILELSGYTEVGI